MVLRRHRQATMERPQEAGDFQFANRQSRRDRAMTDVNAANEALPVGSPDAGVEDERVWGRSFSLFDVFARNISMDYCALGLEMLVGVVMLPFNVAHLGQSAYGLWVLAASITAYS